MNRRTIQLTSITLTSLVSMSSFVHPKQYQLALNILTLALTGHSCRCLLRSLWSQTATN